MTYHEHKYHDRRIAITVLDEHGRLVARAKPIHTGGYMLVGMGLSFIDKRAMIPNVFGQINPKYMQVKTAREARKIMKDMI